jgi:hypothetical protein
MPPPIGFGGGVGFGDAMIYFCFPEVATELLPLITGGGGVGTFWPFVIFTTICVGGIGTRAPKWVGLLFWDFILLLVGSHWWLELPASFARCPVAGGLTASLRDSRVV